MAIGLSLPLRARNGRVVLASREEQLRTIILMGLMDCSSDNPFQDLGIDLGIVFSIGDPFTEAVIRIRVEDAFRQLEADGRARLHPDSPQFRMDSETEEMVVDVAYIDLEINDEAELSLAWGPDGPRLVE